MTTSPLQVIENPSIEDKVQYPGEWWGQGWDRYNDRVQELREEMLSGRRIVISDNDVDGTGCVAVFECAFGDVCRGVIEGRKQDKDFPKLTPLKCLKEACEHSAGQDLYMVDIYPNQDNVDDIVHFISEYPGDVHIYDHHDWNDSVYNRIDDVATELDVRPDGDVCASDIVFEKVKDEVSRTRKISDLVDVIRDHDIWIKEDERSYDLADLQFELDEDTFIDILKMYGADVKDNKNIRQLIRDKREEKNKKIDVQVKKADWYVFNQDGEPLNESDGAGKGMDGIVVAFTYGTAYHSGVGNVLCEGWDSWSEESPFEWDGELVPDVDYQTDEFEPGDADIAVMMKPWDKVSLRSSEDYPYCNNIAEELGGGGHSHAAGFQPGVINTNGVGKHIDIMGIGFSSHWERKGSELKKALVKEIDDILESKGFYL
jgi:oligoribonuclease NrnB/cAMP/cGMP phosphodiesterase (DHH superfamily)